MKLFSKLLLLILPSIFFCFGTTTVLADAKSDYEYQYSLYRGKYIEYKLLKSDYISNPTLDNQQKAILAAKETLSARDLAKSNYAEYLLSLIKNTKANYKNIDPIIFSLTKAKNFFSNEALKSQSIATPADLKNFTQEYNTNVIEHDHSSRAGVVAYKLSLLVHFQQEMDNALNIILPKLATPISTPLKTKIEDLQKLGKSINASIDELANTLLSEEDLANIESENYFSEKSEAAQKIKSQQLKWMDSLIDIDLNYAHS
ncbi:MAG TPA: hypothetical protein PLI45_02055 [Candidatus Woesebacteria bacterium]|nr:hypothetical protein [Candidatus Woesebacteria bacterium]